MILEHTIHSFTVLYTHSLYYTLIHCIIHSFTVLYTHSLHRILIHCIVHSFTVLYTHSLYRTLIQCTIHSFTVYTISCCTSIMHIVTALYYPFLYIATHNVCTYPKFRAAELFKSHCHRVLCQQHITEMESVDTSRIFICPYLGAVSFIHVMQSGLSLVMTPLHSVKSVCLINWNFTDRNHFSCTCSEF